MRHARPLPPLAAALAATFALVIAGCAASGEGAARDEVLGGRWGALISEQGGERDSLALSFTRRADGAVAGHGERWIGKERVAVVANGKLVGDTLSFTMRDSGGRAVNGPSSFTGRAAGAALAGTFADGPFPTPLTLRREP